uniref:Uncharacterized protein n=1 Tax=Glossina austeni TaxID=7395 RepID=A0A1A9V107_GLOAU
MLILTINLKLTARNVCSHDVTARRTSPLNPIRVLERRTSNTNTTSTSNIASVPPSQTTQIASGTKLVTKHCNATAKQNYVPHSANHLNPSQKKNANFAANDPGIGQNKKLSPHHEPRAKFDMQLPDVKATESSPPDHEMNAGDNAPWEAPTPDVQHEQLSVGYDNGGINPVRCCDPVANHGSADKSPTECGRTDYPDCARIDEELHQPPRVVSSSTGRPSPHLEPLSTHSTEATSANGLL